MESVLRPFGSMFLSPPHFSEASKPELELRIRERVEAIEKQQPQYHPIYGFSESMPSYRINLLERNCNFVRSHFENVIQKRQIRILDVGCNCGFASFSLSETLPNVVGLEIMPDHLDLCRMLASYNNSTARFYDCNIVDVIEQGEDDLESVDAVLLFNVVHQLIFRYGLSYTKAFMARLVSRVDVVFVELAKREDYISHGKDHLLPWEPDEVFADCNDLEVTRLTSEPRPLYLLRRKRARFGSIEIEPTQIGFSDNFEEKISRKYYTGGKDFVKLYRFNDYQGPGDFRNEVKALLRMRDSGFAPVITDWLATPSFAAVKMSAVRGTMLREALPRFKTDTDRRRAALEILRIAHATQRRVGYHNDMAPHNLIVAADGRIVLVDFEQATAAPVIDPFGVLLWTLHDLWVGRPVSYEKSVFKSLWLEAGQSRSNPANYPEFGQVSLDETMSALVSDARIAETWDGFLNTWTKQLASKLDRDGA
ncbi:methyltransferase domain-containing protein [Roseomonas nepalensis]|uniref:Methyltransferase domain-containing protein n=1 Tax=Muricoccus nepalensis TaxID=1854500 RepID=A0A502EQ58_9PROT|nr:class I SAM-dependent methyltransferase [Roseomonas nepalensis]TPG39913.1 methyltransferase domain-containing protein [Roseomonas nepalensis]